MGLVKRNVGDAVLAQLRWARLRGIPPSTVRELADWLGASTTAVRNNLRVLERAGRVRQAGVTMDGGRCWTLSDEEADRG